jgi:hypothetical protein
LRSASRIELEAIHLAPGNHNSLLNGRIKGNDVLHLACLPPNLPLKLPIVIDGNARRLQPCPGRAETRSP